MEEKKDKKGFVDTVLDYLKNRTMKRSAADKSTRGIFGWAFAAVAMLAIAYAKYQMSKKAKEIGELKHYKDMHKLSLERNTTKLELQNLEESSRKLSIEVAKENKKVIEIETEIATIEKEQKNDLDKIKQLKTWDDIDTYLDGK